MKIEFYANMTCASCEKTITKSLDKVKGIKKVSVDYVTEKVVVDYNPKLISKDTILETVENSGYSCSLEKKKKNILNYAIGLVFLVIGAFLIFNLYTQIQIPDINSGNASLLIVLVIGLITGLHCVSMCGGMVLSYTANNKSKSKILPHLKYGAGKTISYAVIGGLFGLLGSFITFTPAIKAGAAILAGTFLIIFGLNMLNIFPILRKIRIGGPSIRTKSSDPFVIGVFNGFLLACGPLQAMYVLAASIGGFWNGFMILMMFGLGTLPALFGFGYLASHMGHGMQKKFLKISGVLIIILGIIMFNRGLALNGSSLSFESIKQQALSGAGANNDASIAMEGEFQVIEMHVTNRGWEPDKFVLKKGVPVKWKIYGDQINGCNNEIVVKQYGLRIPVKPGLQEITFTPTESKIVSWSCWMGMISGTFIVQDDVGSASDIAAALNTVPQNTGGGSCGASGGGCGCGGAR